ADGVAVQSAAGRVTAAVRNEEAEAKILRIELILVTFEVDLSDQAGEEHVPDADKARDRGARLVGRLLVVADVAVGAEQNALVDVVLVPDLATAHAPTTAIEAVILETYSLESVAAWQVAHTGAPHVTVDVRRIDLLVALIGEIGECRHGARQVVARPTAELQ